MTPKKWRKSTGYNTQTLAKLLGVSQSYISLLESGKRTPSYKVLKDYYQLSEGVVSLDSFISISNDCQDNSHKRL